MSRRLVLSLHLCLVFLLASCRPHLPMRVVLDREPVERGLPAALVTRGEGRYVDPNGGAVSPGEILRPGDVLYVGRWWPSTLDRTKHSFHWYGPQNFSERFPLRLVDDVHGSLRPYERTFLATVLSVHRSDVFNAVSAQGDRTAQERLLRYRNALAKNEVALWNALVRALKAKIVDYSANDASSPDGPEASEPNVFVTVSTAALGRILDEITAPEDKDGHLYSRYIRMDQDERELFAIDEGFHSPWDSLIGTRDGYPFEANQQFYATASSESDFVRDPPEETKWKLNCTTTGLEATSDEEAPSDEEANDEESNDEEESTDTEEQPDVDETTEEPQPLTLVCDPPPPSQPEPSAPAGVPYATFNFYDVDLDGISMALPGNEERRWTLEDWNASDVCRTNEGIPTRIEQVLFKGSTAPYLVVPDAMATHALVPDFRRERVVHVKPRACTACNNIRSIARSDLRRLYVSDVRSILWSHEESLPAGATRKPKKHVMRIPNCSPR